MSYFQGALLGIIQGLTEFLPVSSSGHLVLAQELIGFDEPALSYDAALHIGTLLAVLTYFRADVILLLRSGAKWLLRQGRDEYTAIIGYLAIGSIPASLVGILFERFFVRAFASITAVGIMLIVTGLILWLSKLAKPPSKTLQSMGGSDALWIGIAQAAAIMPGLSRSASTITAGIWSGMEREAAAKFSFLLSLPVIIGAAAFSTFRSPPEIAIVPALVVGMITAAISGFGAIAALMKILQRRELRLFSLYCFIMGSLAVALDIWIL